MKCFAAKVFIFDAMDGHAGDTIKEMQCQKEVNHPGAHFVMLPGNEPQSWTDDDNAHTKK